MVEGVRKIKGLPGVTLKQLSERTADYFEKHEFKKLNGPKHVEAYGLAVFHVFEQAQDDSAKFGSLLRRILDSCPAGAFTVKKKLLI